MRARRVESCRAWLVAKDAEGALLELDGGTRAGGRRAAEGHIRVLGVHEQSNGNVPQHENRFLTPLLGPASLEVLGAHARGHAAAVSGRLRAAHEAEAVREPRHLVTTIDAHIPHHAVFSSSTRCMHNLGAEKAASQGCRRRPARPRQAAGSGVPLRSKPGERNSRRLGSKKLQRRKPQKGCKRWLKHRCKHVQEPRSLCCSSFSPFSNRYRRSAFKRITRPKKRMPLALCSAGEAILAILRQLSALVNVACQAPPTCPLEPGLPKL